MRTHALLDPRVLAVFLNQFVHPIPAQWLAVTVEKQGGGEWVAAILEVRRERFLGLLLQDDLPIRFSLAVPDRQHVRSQVDIRHCETTQFGDAQAALQQDRQDRKIAWMAARNGEQT